MPKPRSKFATVREERKRKRQEVSRVAAQTKRRRLWGEDLSQDEDNDGAAGEYKAYQGSTERGEDGPGEREFFGMLADEEQEYFRRADEMLELNQFPTTEERNMFVESVFKEARGKELKMASSQSCSRLMERLTQLSTTSQKKHLFEAFGGHFLSLVRHRFASHCCEALFLQCAPLVTQELAGFVMDTQGASVDQHQAEMSMEHLFLAMLDELEGSLSFLMTDRFASHVLRILLLVLSGRPLEDRSAKKLVKSKKKENILVTGVAAADAEQSRRLRVVPASFTLAVQKIITDSTAGLDATGLRVLAKHPIGNPLLQLLLELDVALNKADKKPITGQEEFSAETATTTTTTTPLLQQLLPGAPKSLSDPTSEASELINGMVYDPIGSRLVETLVQHSPGKIFKQLNHNFFLPRIEGYVRNDVSCYPAIRVLERLGKDHLVDAVDKIMPTVPQLVSRRRFNVVKTLFERCAARGLAQQTKDLIKGVKQSCGPDAADLVLTLCCCPGPEPQPSSSPSSSPPPSSSSSTVYAIQSHGAALLTTILSCPGPHKAVHESILALTPDALARLASTSMPTVTLLTAALATPSANSVFQKSLVAHHVAPHVRELSTSKFGHNLVVAVAGVPCTGKDVSIPFHLKESIMTQLATHEAELRNSWMGRAVWRSWKGDLWKRKRLDWKACIKDVLPPEAASTAPPAAAKR